ncbi:cell division protein FtsH [Candidatus Giovannonibacteria bacterium RIFCSPLOWO2_02_44_8]|uniref:ATP-dependent zinc metalloprotease FtsH n=1 Tax=Candidatus Giovannonibacteria bacterium RIFCSPLOWO2_02_44_8 TaxID=1798355 RepID=A0A1F5XEQ0_9BACT|nr:MAG: cell division protein FtsH [Candidatus Giovannonibacteria bacterium RIFCSPLOWO2_02_44_8]
MKLLSRNLIIGFLILMLLAGAYSVFLESFKEVPALSLSDLVKKINAGEVKSISINGDDLNVTLGDDSAFIAKKEPESSLLQTLSNYGVSKEALDKVAINIDSPSGLVFWLSAILPFLLPFLLIILFFWLAARQVQRSNVQAFTFGQSRARVVQPDSKKERVTFKDVAGVKEAKDELQEIVEFLRSPRKFLDIGARIPKGVLLMGAPGTGKTLLARAVAGEAGVPFFHMSGSEFVEMFVGVGASRVRDLFKMAKRSAPAIIFIDEIDAVGRHRGAGLGGGHDEREQTLNQILVEMDGFEPHESVIVMAGTNRPDVLDPALLRPGRFDRRVILDNPDINDREAILKLHSQKKPLEKGVDLRVIAERTPGFSGADLANLMNEAAIVAARDNRKTIEQIDLIRSIEKVLLGPERKSHILSTIEKKISAYHEAGHALVAAILPHADPVHKITIVSRGRAAGYTLKLPSEDRHLYSRKNFLDELAAALGGYASEKLVFGELTTGSSDDIKKATIIARDLVTRYGMSEKIGPITLGERDELVFLGKELGVEKNYSENTAQLVDSEVSNIMKNSFKRAQDILRKYRKVLDSLAGKLIKDETIEREEFDSILSSFGLVQVIGKQAEARA